MAQSIGQRSKVRGIDNVQAMPQQVDGLAALHLVDIHGSTLRRQRP